MTKKLETEAKIARMKGRAPDLVRRLGNSVPLTCPECNGPMRETSDGPILRFRCQVGHGYSLQAMLSGRLEAIEADLWHLASSFMEVEKLAGLLALTGRKEGMPGVANYFRKMEEDARALSKEMERIIQKTPSARFEDEISSRPPRA